MISSPYVRYVGKALPYVASALASRKLAARVGKQSIRQTPRTGAVMKPKPVKRRMRKVGTKSVSSRVKSLEQRQRDTMSLLIYKYDVKDTLKPSVGSATYGYQDAVGTTSIELAIAQCRYFDPSNPGTLVTGSLASPTYFQNILISAKSQMIIKNNYQVPCVVTYGVAYPKKDTSITPNLARTNGLTDVGNPDSSSTLISYRDSPQFNDLWRVKLVNKLLKPGQQIIVKHRCKQFAYDPSLQDSHNQTYQRNTKSSVFIYRCQGVLGHDTTVTSEQGMLPAGIDVYVSTNYYITYNSGGASIRTVVLNENASQSFTNGGVVSQMVVDNQSYSLN